ncbi:hypothetical protein P3T76_004180 [Phytophthora citrophthora]|uniref:Ankyrin repeat-containing domain n=1 Tax=Phytophthora citrophthora TaxID=4793 RepID=A0AAD9GUB4_9STRA|nr:hypothetical protein P3T76_004180 [Phytophthora citrophthora]
MNSTARNGHLDVVKWLHANRSEGCTTEAMGKAAQNNHLAVLKWLDQNRTERFTDKAIRGAVRVGNLEVLEWLYSRQPELCRITAVNCANDVLAYCSHFGVLWFLHQNCRECCLIETLKEALVATGKRLEFAEWAYVHHRHEFELTVEEQLFDDCDVV